MKQKEKKLPLLTTQLIMQNYHLIAHGHLIKNACLVWNPIQIKSFHIH